MNKKIKVVVFVTVVVLFVSGILYHDMMYNKKDSNDNGVIMEVHANSAQFDYDEIKKEAQVIALVKVLDELDEAASTTIDDGYGHVAGFYAMRNVKVLKYFKDEKKLGKDLTIQEPAAISSDQYLHYDGYEKLKKGGKYILFLSDENASGELGIISAQNGAISMDNVNSNEYYEIAVKSIVEFQSDLNQNEKDKILKSKIIKNKIKNADNETVVNVNEEQKKLKYEELEEDQVSVQVIE